MNEVTVTVNVNNADNAIEKLQQLHESIEKAKTAATELALILDQLRLEVDV